MKKLFVVVSILFLIILTGCEKKELITITFEDEQFGFVTKFSYDKTIEYIFTYGQPSENEYANMKLTTSNNIIIDFEYDELTKEQFNINKNSVSNYDDFQEYKFNGYDAYTFSTGDDNLYSMIILGNEKELPNPSIYIRFSLKNDDKKTDIKKFYDSDEFQEFLKSIEFNKVSK